MLIKNRQSRTEIKYCLTEMEHSLTNKKQLQAEKVGTESVDGVMRSDGH